GIEASGKTTVVNEVASILRQKRFQVKLLSEFGSPEICVPIDKALAQSLFISEAFEYGPRAAFFFMLYHEVVKWEEAIRYPSTDVLLADRFVDSLAIYQGHFLPGLNSSTQVVKLSKVIEQLLHDVGVPLPETTYL